MVGAASSQPAPIKYAPGGLFIRPVSDGVLIPSLNRKDNSPDHNDIIEIIYDLGGGSSVWDVAEGPTLWMEVTVLEPWRSGQKDNCRTRYSERGYEMVHEDRTVVS